MANSMSFLISALLFLIACIPVHAGEPDREKPFAADLATEQPRISEIRKNMVSVVFDSLDISRLPLKECVRFLFNNQPRNARGRHYSFILVFSGDSGNSPDFKQPSRLRFTNASLPEVLNHLCERYDLDWSCKGKIIIGNNVE